jgi:hypothetical protein
MMNELREGLMKRDLLGAFSGPLSTMVTPSLERAVPTGCALARVFSLKSVKSLHVAELVLTSHAIRLPRYGAPLWWDLVPSGCNGWHLLFDPATGTDAT